MPSVADISGLAGNALSSDERDYIRQILGISLKTTDNQRIKTETRFDEFTTFENKTARFWMELYGALGDSNNEISAEGVKIVPESNRARAALALYNLLFSVSSITPLEKINVDGHRTSSALTQVPIRFSDVDTSVDEYGG